MKCHPYVANMNGSKPWSEIIRFSSMDNGDAQTAIVPPATNTTHGSKGGHDLSIVEIEIILVVGMFLIVVFLIYIASLYAKRRTRLSILSTISTGPSNQSTAATGSATPDSNVTRTRSRGVDQSVIETFPVIGYAAVKIVRSSKSPLECAICLSEFVDDDILRLLPGCRHVFHTDCIEAWLENHVTCPVCRSNLTDPEVLAGKRLLSMNSELDDFDGSPNISEHEPASDINGPRMKQIRRAQSITEGWNRFTLALPEQMLKEIEATGKHRRMTSMQDYTFQGKASWRDGKLRAFFKSFSRNGRNREGDHEMSTVAEGVEASVSTATSSRQLFEPSIHGETSESEPTLCEVDLTDLPVHERV